MNMLRFLRITKKENKSTFLSSFKTNSPDYVTSAAKAVLGSVPFAGSLFAEIAGVIIPNQRIERIVKYAEELEKRFSRLDQAFVRAQLTNENFTDLLEESIKQAAHSISEERRRYLAAIIANGISSDNIEFSQSKHLLKILGEINDVEAIILRLYLIPTLGGDEEFRAKHKDIITRYHPVMNGKEVSNHDYNKYVFDESYREHLVSLGLLERKYKMEDGIPKLSNGDTLETSGYKITLLGELLLKHIELKKNDKVP